MRKLTMLLLLSAVINLAGAQEKKFTRFGAEIGGGVPIMFGSIPSKISTFGTAGIRYSLTKQISLQTSFQVGSMTGSQTPTAPLTLGANGNHHDLASNYSRYVNNFYQLSANAQFNLNSILNLRKIMPRLNPYLFIGAGRIYSKIEVERLGREPFSITNPNDRSKPFDFYTAYGGLSLKYYLSPQLDLNLNMVYHTTQSAWLDGIPATGNFDSYFMPSFGVQYKINGSADRAHVDWYNVILKGSKTKIVDPDSKDEKPIAQQAIDKAKAKADSLAKENVVIAKENAELKEEVKDLNKEVKSLKEEVNTLSDEVKDLKEKVVKSTETETKENGGDMIIDIRTGKPVSRSQKSDETAGNVVKSDTKQPGTGKIGSTTPSGSLNQYDGIVAPPHKYNVVVGCYTSQRYAFIFRDRMRSMGYDAAIFRSGDDSRMLRVVILSTDDLAEARQAVMKARKDIDQGSWLHIYNTIK